MYRRIQEQEPRAYNIMLRVWYMRVRIRARRIRARLVRPPGKTCTYTCENGAYTLYAIT